MNFELLFLLGAIHGCILAFILALKTVNCLPNRLLALLMVVFSVDLGMAAFHGFELDRAYPDLIGIDYPITLLYGPILFLYVKAMRDGAAAPERADYLHFIPFLILLAYMAPFYLGGAEGKIALTLGAPVTAPAYSFGLINHFKVLHGLTYAGFLVYMLMSYRKKVKDSYSSLDKVNLNWLQNIILVSALIAAIAGGIHFTTFSDNTLMGLGAGDYGNITLLSVTLFVFGIGYMGLYQAEVFSRPVPAGEGDPLPQEQYRKSGLAPGEAERYIGRIQDLMEEHKLYRDSELKLADIAGELSISSHNLTEILNRYMGQNFYDFVNGYRVREVQRKLSDPRASRETLLAVALDAGFSAKSSFNAVFKKQTGMTPSEYRAKNGAKR